MKKITPALPARTYTKIPEAAFCPVCHRRVGLPSFLKTAKIGGQVRVECVCKRGVVVIQPAKEMTPMEMGAD